MLYLILTIAFSATFSLMMKHAHARRYGVLAVGCVNYIVAGIVATAWALTGQPEHLSGTAVIVGCIGGAMYVLCYLCIMVMLERQGISVATAMTRLAIAVPILTSVVVWSERPSMLQTLGLVLTLGAILLFDLQHGSRRHGGAWKEKLGTRTRWGMVLACVALILVNLS